ncbi:BMP family ABC transporter substrate-binding protein [Dongia deserti]|uniref:BMP family ABC transporter substrate-binding protein n=1 Tax=Dongia deserti TaxID=2268030 RepID=UPI000E656385|nr:BMP family ABC transporter substrate-binding protein [Dongia deserti]
MKRRTFNTLLGAGLLAGTAPMIIGRAAAADPLGIGFVYVGPVEDFGWTHAHDVGRKAVEAELGNQVKTTFVESVKEGPDSERVIAELASKGNKLIFTTSFGYMNPTIKVAQRFPDVKFEHCTGYKRAENVSTYNIRFYEGRYVQGVIAGRLSKSGIVGYIGSVPIPEVVMGMNAFIIGMRTVNPKARMKIVWVNAWYDPGKEGDSAKALIDQGADIIAQHTDSGAPLQVAQQRGVLGFGQASDMSALAPKAQLTASVDFWNPYYIQRAKDVIAGTWKSQDVWGGFDSGMLVMAPYANMPDDVAKAGKAAEEGIREGKIVIFKGPIKDQSGAEKVPAGTELDDGAIASMNWLAEGIDGQIPS